MFAQKCGVSKLRNGCDSESTPLTILFDFFLSARNLFIYLYDCESRFQNIRMDRVKYRAQQSCGCPKE